RKASLPFCLAVAVSSSLMASEAAPRLPTPSAALVQTHCYDCHQGEHAEAGLDLSTLGADLSDRHTRNRWVRIFDRVRDGEMPPADAGPIPEQEKSTFLNSAGRWLRDFEMAEMADLGRVRGRRLTSREL